MGKKSENKYYAEGYVQRCNAREMAELINLFLETQEAWAEIKPGQLFIVNGGYGDMFKHEIKEVDQENMKIIAIDHSQKGKEVEITYLPSNLFDNEKELQEWVNKQPPSFF